MNIACETCGRVISFSLGEGPFAKVVNEWADRTLFVVKHEDNPNPAREPIHVLDLAERIE